MTPEERQLLAALTDRVKSSPAQQRDAEAEQVLRQLVQDRPDTPYILAQTVIMQDFALRNAQAQIDELQRQLSQGGQQAQQGSGSFLGGLFGGGTPQPPQPSGSVPRVNPWTPPSQASYGPPPEQYPYSAPGAPVMQPSQTSGFLRSAATTAAGVAGGALLFQGIQSLFSGHHSGLTGLDSSGFGGRDSLSETTVVNNYYDDQGGHTGSGKQNADYQSDRAADTGGFQEADYNGDNDDSFGGDDGPDYA